MKRIFVSILFVSIFALSSFAQQTCARLTETAGGFSYCPPAGWTPKEEASTKFKVVYGPPSATFVANINIMESASTTDKLGDFVDAGVDYILKNAEEKFGVTSITLVSRDAFTTDSKEAGFKVVFRSDYKGTILNSYQYYFSTPKGTLIITTTTLEAEKAVNAKLSDAAMKSMQIDKAPVK